MNEEHELDPETQETLIFKDTWIKQILKEKVIKQTHEFFSKNFL